MYKSPIECIVSQFQEQIIEQQGNQVFQATQKVGVNVDKEELLKALKYDREQYEKGYQDGYVEGARMITEKFVTLLNLEYEQAESIRRIVDKLVGAENGK